MDAGTLSLALQQKSAALAAQQLAVNRIPAEPELLILAILQCINLSCLNRQILETN
jgi:hypothetical protein